MLSGIDDASCSGLAKSSHPEPVAYAYERPSEYRGERDEKKMKLRLSRSEPASASTSRAAARLVSRVRDRSVARTCCEDERWWCAALDVKYGLGRVLRLADGSGSIVVGPPGLCGIATRMKCIYKSDRTA